MSEPDKPTDPNHEISPERKALYYGGMALTGLGLVLFLSVFFTGIANFGNFTDFDKRARSEGFRAIGGMILMIIGGFMMKVGAMGWAGSGMVLNPKQAREEELKPWSKMGGGMVQDVIEEVKLVQKIEDRLEAPPPEIKVRCRKCQALNDETARYCNQCASQL